MSGPHRWALVASLLTALATAPLVAQQPREQVLMPLPPDVALHAKRFGEYAPIRFSPDGRWLAYTIRDPAKADAVTRSWSLSTLFRTGVHWYAVGAEIWLAESETGVPRRLLDGPGEAWGPAWSPDGRSVA